MPNASSSSWTPPYTSRLAPATISPDASSTVAVVSAAPGRNVTSGAISARRPGSAAPCWTASKASADTSVAESTGTSAASAGRSRVTSRIVPTSAPNAALIAASRALGSRTRQSATVIARVREDGHRRAVTGRHRVDRAQPAQPLRRLDLAALGLVHDLVQSRDLVEAQRARELRRGLDRRPSGPSERDHHRGRQHDDASVLSAGRGDDPGEALLRLAHGRARQAQRAPELEHERVQIAGPLGGQCTICISRVVLFRRRPPSSVTVTMSSIRTPKRPLR